MSDAASKEVPRPPDAFPEVVGIGKPPAVAEAQHSRRRPRKSPPPGQERRQDPKNTLLRDALAAARILKRKHRACYDADPKGFRALVTKAQARVFRLKPGPKADPRIAKAARERAGGAKWERLYADYIEYHAQMPEFTRAYAEDGFRKKVTTYLQRHRRRGRKLPKKTATTQSVP